MDAADHVVDELAHVPLGAGCGQFVLIGADLGQHAFGVVVDLLEQGDGVGVVGHDVVLHVGLG